jgi:hypothetical protein
VVVALNSDGKDAAVTDRLYPAAETVAILEGTRRLGSELKNLLFFAFFAFSFADFAV